MKNDKKYTFRRIDECPEVPDTPEYDKWISSYMHEPILRIDQCPYSPNTPEYDKWIDDYMNQPRDSEGGLSIIDSCPCVPDTPEYENWISSYMHEPLLRIDQCPYSPGTPEYEKWIDDYMNQPIDSGVAFNVEHKEIKLNDVVKSALKDGVTATAVRDAKGQQTKDEINKGEQYHDEQ